MTQEIEVQDFLEHFGVKGMKWGKRTGGLASRVEGAGSDRTSRNLERAKKVAENTSGNKLTKKSKLIVGGAAAINSYTALTKGGGLGGAVAAGALTGVGFAVTRKVLNKSANQSVKALSARKERYDLGQLNKVDKFDQIMNTSLLSLAVKRTN